MASASVTAEQFLDPLWRINNLYWVVNKDGVRVPFRLNDVQSEFLASLHGRDIVLKARQLGFTTAICIVSLDEAFFNPDWRVAIIAHRLEDAKGIFETKIKYPYDSMPEQLREANPLTKDAADALTFKNNSTVSVTTSARSGTLQRLHVSEFGKICAQYPQKAREIVTGSFPAAENGQITVESTAEGQEGRFYEMCSAARLRPPRSRKDWRFHFFPWWRDPAYVAEPEFAVITPEDERYFQRLEHDEGVTLTDAQKAWWVLTERDQGGDMKREYPATPDEAFEQAIEGAYFEAQIAHAYKHGNVGAFPYDPKYPVNTFWDLGRNDSTTIWLHQRAHMRNRFVGYYENSGEYISHYVDWLKGWQREHDATWEDHYWPHDGKREDLFLPNGRLAVAEELNFRPRIVNRPSDKIEAIEAARGVFAECDFDEKGCALGLKRLKHYRKEWDEQRGVWKDRPRHDENSHGADGFMTFATGYTAPSAQRRPPRKRRSAWAA